MDHAPPPTREGHHINTLRGDGSNPGLLEMNGTVSEGAMSQLMANLVALFCKWRNLDLRFCDEGHHREAIRAGPFC